MKSEAYLRLVRSLSCRVCGIKPCREAHHIRIAIPKRMGKRVGDEWTVPLCHRCHMELHHFGDERTWWAIKGFDPVQWCASSYSQWKKKQTAKKTGGGSG